MDGDRLIAGNFNENGLNCNNWWNENANDDIGFFLLMLYQEKRRPFPGPSLFSSYYWLVFNILSQPPIIFPAAAMDVETAVY